jgi:hypothetical protein
MICESLNDFAFKYRQKKKVYSTNQYKLGFKFLSEKKHLRLRTTNVAHNKL